MQQKLVTVITPTYMQGAYIRDCIESVKSQSYPFVEHLIFDAGSSDQTEAIARSYEGQYNLRFVSEADRGQAHAINKGLAQAQGQIICWLNSDDLFHHDKVLETIVSLFALHPQTDVITAGGIYVSEDGQWLEDIPVEAKVGELRYVKRTCLALQPSTFWRSNELRLDESLHYAFDWKFWLDMLAAQKQFLLIPDPLSRYRVHGESKTQQDLAARKKEVLWVSRYARNGFVQNTWNWLVFRLFLLAERWNLGFVKRAVNFLNKVLYKLSGGLIYSS
ncbi:MAG: glycosyltransferase family 2 protein [Bacteroidota bacterium]